MGLDIRVHLTETLRAVESLVPNGEHLYRVLGLIPGNLGVGLARVARC